MANHKNEKNQPDPIKLNKMIKHDAFNFEKTRCRFYSIEFSTVEFNNILKSMQSESCSSFNIETRGLPASN